MSEKGSRLARNVGSPSINDLIQNWVIAYVISNTHEPTANVRPGDTLAKHLFGQQRIMVLGDHFNDLSKYHHPEWRGAFVDSANLPLRIPPSDKLSDLIGYLVAVIGNFTKGGPSA